MRSKVKNNIESLIKDVLSGRYERFKDLIYILQNDKDTLSRNEARVGMLFIVLVEDFDWDFDWDKEENEGIFVFYKELVEAVNRRFEEWNYPSGFKIPEKGPGFPFIIGNVLGKLSEISWQVCKIPVSCVVVNREKEPGPGFLILIKRLTDNNINIKENLSEWQKKTRALFRELKKRI